MCKFHDPMTGVLVPGLSHMSHIVNVRYFLINHILYSQVWIRKIKYIVMMTRKDLPKFFMTPGARFL